ncbi:hypothetical protein BC829DRAFT_407068 [Chytridium lagenaria]|nr:hypothetical protein BC829DRAFT_407068 [Chytridium lagenaria]
MVNWNHVLAYQTLKTVNIRDWRLGLFHYSLEIGIFAYILYEIITKTLYVAKFPVVNGSIRTQLQLNTSAVASSPIPSFCNETSGGCLFWTEREAVFPEASDNSIFITTRVTITTYPAPTLNCSSSTFPYLSTTPDYSCTPFGSPNASFISRSTYYIPHVEKMTLLIDHTARRNDMVGKLYDTSGKELANYDEKYHEDNRKKRINGDVLAISDILTAANIDLGKVSGAPGAGVNETQRSAGVVVSFLINPYSVSLKYKYFPAQVTNTEYKALQTIYNSNGTVTVLNRHGVYLIFAQSGQIGAFSFMALLTNLVASFALLKVASLVVDFLMTMVLPSKEIYKEAKFQITEDIGKQRVSMEDPPEIREDYLQATQAESKNVQSPTGCRLFTLTFLSSFPFCC